MLLYLESVRRFSLPSLCHRINCWSLLDLELSSPKCDRTGITICPLAVGLCQVRRQGKGIVREVAPLSSSVLSSFLRELKDHLIRPTLYKHKPAAWRAVTHRLHPPSGRYMHIHLISQPLVFAPSRFNPSCFIQQNNPWSPRLKRAKERKSGSVKRI